MGDVPPLECYCNHRSVKPSLDATNADATRSKSQERRGDFVPSSDGRCLNNVPSMQTHEFHIRFCGAYLLHRGDA